MSKIESDLLDAAGVVSSTLRIGRGLESSASARLKEALQAAAIEWENSDVIPKSAANLFSEFVRGIEACSYLYEEQEAKEIRLFADQINDLILRCVELKDMDVGSD